jgi:hypothetical protein
MALIVYRFILRPHHEILDLVCHAVPESRLVNPVAQCEVDP